jgi:guanosine-3',5'-bis(diphosphate) 3'-pyrophosphohydrolase
MIFRDTTRIARAIEFVSQRHPADALEHDFFHLLEVSRILSDATDGNDEDLVIAGMLHHTLESGLATREELTDNFGNSAAGLVSELTSLRSKLTSASNRPDSSSFKHYADRTKMLFAADIVSILSTHPQAHLNIARHGVTEEVWRIAEVFATCFRNVNSRLETRFFDVVKPNESLRFA